MNGKLHYFERHAVASSIEKRSISLAIKCKCLHPLNHEIMSISLKLIAVPPGTIQ